jgi:hypothetical protein
MTDQFHLQRLLCSSIEGVQQGFKNILSKESAAVKKASAVPDGE